MTNEDVSLSGGASPEIGYYYPNQFWHSGDWIKSLVLFFDGVGLLVPDYMKDRFDRFDPAVTEGLREHGLLRIFEPETFVDKEASEKLADAMSEVIASGALDDLADSGTAFAELSYSRLGGYGDPGLANMIHDELKARGLARDTEDGVSVPLHPAVRSLVLVLLAQLLRPYGSRMGLDLSPVTDRLDVVRALQELLSLPTAPSAGSVVSFDLATVGVDLSAVPVNEVLDFRREHLGEHKAYARKVRQFVRELSTMSDEQRREAFEDRQQELDDLAGDLRRSSRRAWKLPAAFALTVTGAAWTATTSDPVGAILSGAGGLLGLSAAGGADAGAYSYLFKATRYS